MIRPNSIMVLDQLAPADPFSRSTVGVEERGMYRLLVFLSAAAQLSSGHTGLFHDNFIPVSIRPLFHPRQVTSACP